MLKLTIALTLWAVAGAHVLGLLVAVLCGVLA